MYYTEAERRINLIRLLVGITELKFKTQFRMGHYSRGKSEDNYLIPRRTNNECGTSACLMGHGPLCGIIPSGIGEEKCWRVYSLKFVYSEMNAEWIFVFSATWPSLKSQGRARIHRFLTKGIPKQYDVYKSRYRLPTATDMKRYKKELRNAQV